MPCYWHARLQTHILKCIIWQSLVLTHHTHFEPGKNPEVDEISILPGLARIKVHAFENMRY